MNLSQIMTGTVQEFQEMVARINTVFGREHHADGTHILPKWHTVPFSASYFSSPTAEWVVTSAGYHTYYYWKHGDCLCTSVVVVGTLSGAASEVNIRLPERFQATSFMANTGEVQNAGVIVSGLLYVSNHGTQIRVVRTDRASFTAGELIVLGQLLIRTTA